MSPGSHETADHDRRLDLIIYEIECAFDRNSPPTAEESIARHPEFAEELTEYFGARKLLGNPCGRTPGVDDRVGDYLLLEHLGKGGQERSFARHWMIADRVVALKLVPAGVEASLRLQEEIRALAGLKHPNIVPIHSFDEDRRWGVWYYTMELMERGSLEVPERNLRHAVVLLEQVARGVHHAHSRGILHLDLKPANILLNEGGRPHVSDFGLARRFLASGGGALRPDRLIEPAAAELRECLALSHPQIEGTAPYMSPEMASGTGSAVTTAADIYGLGAILYAMLTGRAPSQGESVTETLRRVLFDQPEPPRALNPKVNRELQAVCLKALQKDPARRFGSADALANDLNRWLRGEPTLAGKPTVAKVVGFWMMRCPYRLALACLIALAFWLAGVAGSLGELSRANMHDAERLARNAEKQLRMIEHAVELTARDQELRRLLRAFPDGSSEQRLRLDEFLTRSTADFNLRFDVAGGNPLFNVFVLNGAGVLLADTLPNSPAVGQQFSLRDYFHPFVDRTNPMPRNAVRVSHVFHSLKDSQYKIAVSTRVWDGDGGKCLGVLVANVTIGPKLVGLDMTEEPEGAFVVSPVDASYRERGSDPAESNQPYVVALGRAYASGRVEPIWIDPARLPHLADFDKDRSLSKTEGRIREVAVTSYHRVGSTPLVVVLRHDYPWPVRLVVLARLRLGTLLALAALVAVAILAPTATRRLAEARRAGVCVSKP